MKKKRILAGMLVLTMLAALLNPLAGLKSVNAEALNEHVFITATDDAFIRDGNQAGVNFGADEHLIVKNDAAGFSRRSYIKFDISDLDRASTEKVVLRLEGVKRSDDDNLGMGPDFEELSLYRVDTEWNEGTVNWNNAPYSFNGAGITEATEPLVVIDKKSVEDNDYIIEIDLTYLVTDELGKNTKELAFVFCVDEYQKNNIFSFYSKENTKSKNKPTLDVTINKYQEIKPLQVYTDVGVPPVLPEKAEAVTVYGDIVPVPVTWDTIEADQYAELGSFIVQGAVPGTDLKAQVKVNVVQSLIYDRIEMPALKSAFVRDGSHGNNNYSSGSDGAVLTLKNSDSPGYSRKFYLELDISDIEDNMNYFELQMQLVSEKVLGADFNTAEIFRCEEFAENTVTWNTAPKRLSSVAAASFDRTNLSSTATGTMVAIDVTDMVKTALAAGEQILYLEFFSPKAVSNDEFHVHSTRAGEGVKKPTLVAMERSFIEVLPCELTYTIGEELTLPEKITAKFDGQEMMYDVVWDAVDDSLLRKVGSFELSGFLNLYGYPVSLTVYVELPEDYTGVTYYVDSQDGNDENDGQTEYTPFQSLKKINSLYLLPGDRVLLKAGGIWNGQLAPRGSGLAGRPIVLDLYGEGNKPIINGNGEHTTNISGAVMIVNEEYWEIRNLEVTNYGAGESYDTHMTNNLNRVRSGILVFSNDQTKIKNHIVVENCYVHDVVSASDSGVTGHKMSGGIIVLAEYRDLNGISLGQGVTKAGFHDVRLENNKVERVMKEGIRTKVESSSYSYEKNFTDVTIRNNYINSVTGDGIVLAEVKSGGLVEKNLIRAACEENYKNANFAGVWTHFCDDALVQYNEVDGVKYGYNDGEAFDIDNQCYRNIFQYNYSHDNYGGACLFMNTQHDTHFRYNVSYNDAWGTTPSKQHMFFYAIGTRTDITSSLIPKIYNNTFYFDASYKNGGNENFTIPMFGSNDETVVNFQNNIVAAEPGAVNITFKTGSANNFNSNSIIKNNLFSRDDLMVSHGLTKEWLVENGNLYGDPMFVSPERLNDDNTSIPDDYLASMREKVSNFTPKEGSPTIGSGAVVAGNDAEEDILGNYLGDTPSIGAIDIQLAGMEFYTAKYTAEEGGRIRGAATQRVVKNEDGSEVEAVANYGYEFVKWSDGVTEKKRKDLNIQDHITVTAEFQAVSEAEKPFILLYDKPASIWKSEALPLGNGHISAMVFGKTDTEHIQLNEKTLWTGGTGGTGEAAYQEKDPLSDAYGNIDLQSNGMMDSFVDYLFDCYYKNIKPNYTNSTSSFDPYKIVPNNRDALGAYQNFADMYIDFDHNNTTGYERSLNLGNAVSTVEYTSAKTVYSREMFINYPDNVMVYHITANEGNKVSFTLRPEIADLGTTTGSHNRSFTKTGAVTADAETGLITMQGTLEHNGMVFEGQFKVVLDGGMMNADNASASKGKLMISDANSATIYITLGTNYANSYPDYRMGDKDSLHADISGRIEAAVQKGRDLLYEEHLDDYQNLFNRVTLDLGGTFDPTIPTDKLLSQWKADVKTEVQNHYLEELYYQYGRYLLIASSREDSLPANLQGIWNNSAFPDWQADYHTNINLQMNYWPAYMTNLSETGLALVDYVDSLQEPGAVTAEKTFGVENGWIVNCSANALGFTGNINSGASFTSTANAFLLNNIYDHYLYTQDKSILQNQIYPMMKRAAKTHLQILQPGRTEADQDKLFVVPSLSSEHGPWTVGTTFDQQLVYMLFQDTVEAAKELGYEDSEAALIAELEDAMGRLHPVTIGKSGQIKEWQQEGEYGINDGTGQAMWSADKLHRHNSQLMLLHPGNQITTETPEWMEAAKTTLTLRGDGATGWSMGQKLNMWARLHDGNHAYNKLFINLLSDNTFNNLFDVHAPAIFQIDGNFGAVSGMTEMLLQSHGGYIEILPALPDVWADGSVSGIVARGNYQIDLTWQNKAATSVTILSKSGGRLKVKAGVIDGVTDLTSNQAVTGFKQEADGSVSFDTAAGHSYSLAFYDGAASLSPVEEAINKVKENINTYYYTAETAGTYEEALLAAERMVSQGNFVVSMIQDMADRLTAAAAALELRPEEQMNIALALQFAAEAETYYGTGTASENQWRQNVESLRKELLKTSNLENPEQMNQYASQMVGAIIKLDENQPENRRKLFDTIYQARVLEPELCAEAIAAASQIFLNRDSSEEDIENAYDQLMETMAGTGSIYTVTADAEEGGKISPDGSIIVSKGMNKQFTITADEGYYILDVTVNGVSVGAVGTYQMKNIDSDMEIFALFERQAAEVEESENKLLKLAIEKAESLTKANYTTESWSLLKEALAAAKAAVNGDEEEQIAKAEELLEAIRDLEANTDFSKVRTEAETGLVLTENGMPEEFPEGKNLIFGYPDGGPVPAPGSAGKDGKWVKQALENLSDGEQMICKTKDAWAMFKFTGSRVAFTTEYASTASIISVFIDDEWIADIDTVSETNDRNKTAFDSADYEVELSEGEHVLKLVAASSGKEDDSYQIFRLDAFDVYTAMESPDMTELLQAIAAAETAEQNQYTQETWEALQEALEDARQTALKEYASEEEIMEALEAVQTAYSNLINEEYIIDSVAKLMAIAVPLDTKASDLVLPSDIMVTAGTYRTRVPVLWNLDNYDGSIPADYILEGELDLENIRLSNAENRKAQIMVTVLESNEIGYEITGVESLKGITVGLGTPADRLALPEAVMVTTQDTKYRLNVIWDTTPYQADAAGTYRLTGELQLPADSSLLNTGAYKAEIDVIVEAKANDTNRPGSSGSISVKPKKTTVAGWKLDDQGWWYETGRNSYAKAEWKLLDGNWYYFDASGYMAVGWRLLDHKWYWLNGDGRMVSDDWILYHNEWYYLDTEGRMIENNWILYKDNWYYLGMNGGMSVNTVTPDAYKVDMNGAWIR